VVTEDVWIRALKLASTPLGAELSKQTLDDAVDVAIELTQATRGLVVTTERTLPETVSERHAAGLTTPAPTEKVDPTIVRKALAAKKLLQVDGPVPADACHARSTLVAPLDANGDVQGALVLHDPRNGTTFTREDARRLEAFLPRLGTILERLKRRATRRIVRADQPRRGLDRLVGESPVMIALKEEIRRWASSPETVLIQGGEGTGKELVAQAIHEESPRRDKAFVAMSMADVPGNLLEAEIFGHEKGAFTGADRAKVGLFGQAHGGTLFLDEIGEMPLELQSKLLRVLQKREYRPLGGGKLTRLDVRILAATNRDLHMLVSDGRFRSDLRSRLDVLRVKMPPLRERGDDVIVIARIILCDIALEQSRAETFALSEEAIATMRRHHWQGNVRELENALRRAVAHGVNPIPASSLGIATRARKQRPKRAPLKGRTEEQLRELERQVDGNVTELCKLVGVSRTAYYKRKKKRRG
jgi:DNA-binding NtrC family response regulator